MIQSVYELLALTLDAQSARDDCNTPQQPAATTHCNTTRALSLDVQSARGYVLRRAVLSLLVLGSKRASRVVAHTAAMTLEGILPRLEENMFYSMHPLVSVDLRFAASAHILYSVHAATHCNTLQYIATHCNTLQHTITHCNTLQHTATHCNTLQHTATHCNTLQHRHQRYFRQYPTLVYAAG